VVAADLDVRGLKSVCEACPWLHVHAEEGGDWSVLIVGRPSDFVDVYSPRDIYPPELWHAAAAYFEGLGDADMVLPGGRYSCAQALAARRLPFLSGRSLGQVCHIVQLAISQKKILGYLNGAVVPYSRSQSMVKERCAERQRPCTSTVRGAITLASWDTMRRCLVEILAKTAPATGGCVPLSNVKRLFRSRFHLELSETALGHSKLSELLQDSRLRDICTVRLQGHGYVVIPVRSQPPRRRGKEISISGNLAQSCAVEMHAKEAARDGAAPAGTTVVAAPTAGDSLRSLRERARWITPLCMEDVMSTPSQPSPHLVATPGVAKVLSPEARSLPRLLGRAAKACDPVGPCVEEGIHCTASPEKLRRHPLPPPVSPSFSGSAPCSPPSKSVITQMPARPVLLTPGRLGDMGFSVHNTFLHAAMPPPTPLAGALSRARSLPRDLGSRRYGGWGTPSAVRVDLIPR